MPDRVVKPKAKGPKSKGPSRVEPAASRPLVKTRKRAANASDGPRHGKRQREPGGGGPPAPGSGEQDEPQGDERKLAPRIAARIEAEIIQRRWPVGQVLGSEAELIERYNVSRAVFREAVRIVESHHAASMRRGPNGGLVVTAPDISGVQASAALFLDYTGVEHRDLYEARAALELTSVRQVVERLDEDIIARLRASMVEEEREVDTRGLTARGGDIHQLIAELSGNSALWLFVEVLLRLMRQQGRGKVPNDPGLAAEMHRAHVLIIDAIIAGDIGLAQHRMSKHLQASLAFYH